MAILTKHDSWTRKTNKDISTLSRIVDLRVCFRVPLWSTGNLPLIILLEIQRLGLHLAAIVSYRNNEEIFPRTTEYLSITRPLSY